MQVRFKRFDLIDVGENEHVNPEFAHFNRNELEFAHATVFINFNV